MTDKPSMRLFIRVSGRVQGVGYRDWTRRTAGALGLTGWVRNRRDGAVEALAIGPATQVAALVKAMKSGPPLASVAAIETRIDETDEAPQGFEVRPTA